MSADTSISVRVESYWTWTKNTINIKGKGRMRFSGVDINLVTISVSLCNNNQTDNWFCGEYYTIQVFDYLNLLTISKVLQNKETISDILDVLKVLTLHFLAT